MAKTDELELDPNAKASGGKGKLIIIIVLVVLLTAGSVIGALYFMGVLGGGKDAAKDSGDKTEQVELKAGPAYYFDLAPPFIVNFEDQSEAAYLQIEMQALMHDKSVEAQLQKHMPVIRNNILLVMGSQKYEEVKTRQGKEALQAKILEAIQEIVGNAMKESMQEDSDAKVKETEVPNVEQVYFTSFIMQ